MEDLKFKELKLRAGYEGFFMGLLWLLSFGCFVGQFERPVLGTISMLVALSSAVAVVLRLIRYRDRNLYDLSFVKAFSYSLSVYVYASLIFAFGQWLYFQFLDNGYMAACYMEHVSSPEFKQLMSSIKGFDIKEMKDAVTMLSELRPIDIALQFMAVNIPLSFVLALPTALIAAGKGKG
ncbi:MAG: DUF4199 domain-containing protein [Bacteroidaceae bacterium]|nr:DUF4199 domain-containing protein [Bacteroidaceae bacterium]